MYLKQTFNFAYCPHIIAKKSPKINGIFFLQISPICFAPEFSVEKWGSILNAIKLIIIPFISLNIFAAHKVCKQFPSV